MHITPLTTRRAGRLSSRRLIASAVLAALGVLALLPSPLEPALLRRPAPVMPANVRVDAGAFPAYGEPALAQGQDNPLALAGAAKMFSDPAHYVFRIGTFYSTDGGATWHDNGPLPGLGQFEVTSDVAVATAPPRHVYLSVLAADVHHGHGSGVYLYRSTNGGLTYSGPLTVTTHPRGGDDKDQLAVDTTNGPYHDTIYVTWCYWPARHRPHIEFAASRDGGQTWRILPALDAGVARIAQFAEPFVGPDGTVYVTFVDLASNAIYLTASRDGGLSFGRPARVATFVPPPDRLTGGFRATAIPTAAVAPNGTLLVAWNDHRTGDTDILVAFSTTHGATWQGPYRLNDDRTRTDQFQPAVAALPDGSFALSYFDRAEDPTHNLLTGVTAARYVPGQGATYAHVSSRSFDPTLGGIMAGPHVRFLGDYQGLSAGPQAVHLLWNDTRDGTPATPATDLYSASLPRRLFTAQTPRPLPPAAPLPAHRRPVPAPGPDADAG
jgi:hypothetical protein